MNHSMNARELNREYLKRLGIDGRGLTALKLELATDAYPMLTITRSLDGRELTEAEVIREIE